MKSEMEKYATLSLVSTVLTGIFTSIHHSYEIAYKAIVLALFVVVLPVLTMQWLKRTGSRVALWVYGLLTAWLVLAFGMIDGLWNHTINGLGSYVNNAVLSIHGSMPSGGEEVVANALAGNLIYQAAGVLTFIASTFAAYYGIKFLRTRKQLVPASIQNVAKDQNV